MFASRLFRQFFILSLPALLCVFSLNAHADTSAQNPASLQQPVNALVWKDIAGNQYSDALFSKNSVTVFVFTSTQCPISNLYTTRIKELEKQYHARGVQFFVVNSNQEDTLQMVKKYSAKCSYNFPVVKDNGTAIADKLHASRTPESIVLDSKGVVRYRGRIDDNTDRNKIVRHDLADALEAVVTGGIVSRPRTLATGCVIFRDSSQTHSTMTSKYTYSHDIAPILNANCVVCHRAGETGPFSLTTYQEAKTWAAAIKDYTARRVMPPWKAVPGYGDFHDTRSLSSQQIAMISNWADSGAPQGSIGSSAALPSFPAPGKWAMGTPDVELKPEGAYHLAAEGADVYRNYVLPYNVTSDQYIKGIAFQAGNRAVVHHIILFLDMSGKSVELDKADPEPGYSVPGTTIGVPFLQTIWVAGWAPGNTPRLMPPGIAFKMPKGAKLVLQVHYHKSGQQETDLSRMALYFTDKSSVDKEIYTNALIYPYLALKPGIANQVVRQKLTLPVDVHAFSVAPHMHMLGRIMKVNATLPTGEKIPLVYINDWDFNWQETYRYKKPVALPKGTVIDMEASFDNSEMNPRQPSHPPKYVSWGEQTTDEMCICFFQMTVDKQHLQSTNASSDVSRKTLRGLLTSN